MRQIRLLCLLTALALAPTAADAWMWGLPAKVDGIFFLDRFGGLYFYNDIGMLPVTQKTRDIVLPHVNRLVSVTVTRTYQLMIPGDIRLDTFTIVDPAEDVSANSNRLQLIASLQEGSQTAIKLSLVNHGVNTLSVYPAIIDFFAFAKGPSEKERRLRSDVSDGPSALIGKDRLSGWGIQRNWGGTYGDDRESLSWKVRSGSNIKDKVDLLPGHGTDIFLDCESSAGEYQMLFAYKVLRDSSFETGMKINDLVLPVVSNSIVVNSGLLHQMPPTLWIVMACLFIFLLHRLVRARRLNVTLQ